MKVATLLKIIRDLTTHLESMGLILPNDDFGAPTPQQDAELALYVEQQLIKHGVQIPDKIVKVTELLPIILSMVR